MGELLHTWFCQDVDGSGCLMPEFATRPVYPLFFFVFVFRFLALIVLKSNLYRSASLAVNH
jgi:hypothetical protein